MTMDAQGFPQISAPFVDPSTGQIHQTWLQLLIALFNRTGGAGGLTPAPFAPVVVGGSPFTYQASVYGHIWIDEGTYASVTIIRDGVSLSGFGKITRGIFPLSPGDRIVVTYTDLPPTMYFI